MTSFSGLFGADIILTVKAAGYWYTSGGVKGSFGYYPHLKDDHGLPFFPDTQVRGNLKTAVQWYCNLIGTPFPKNLFGEEGAPSASLLKVGDLVLTPNSRKIWEKSPCNRFQVKTRIAIAPETRTVKPKFLVNLETAWLDELELESQLYLVGFPNKKTLEETIAFFEEAVALVPGFGAFRSRGYGRGEVFLKKKVRKPVKFSTVSREAYETKEKKEKKGKKGKKKKIKEKKGSGTNHRCITIPTGRFRYFLKALTNMRSKPPGTGTLQEIETMDHISSNQIRAWFVNTWKSFTGEWPDMALMERIDFSPLYPCPGGVDDSGENYAMGFPPPMSTLKDENGRIEDTWQPEIPPGSGMDEEKEEEEKSNETIERVKTKPLGRAYMVTDEDPPGILPVKSEKRMRNRLDDDFITGVDSLFVQELMPAGTLFGGIVTIKPLPDHSNKESTVSNTKPLSKETADHSLHKEEHQEEDTEAARICHIFQHERPLIKGCLFSPGLLPEEPLFRNSSAPIFAEGSPSPAQPAPSSSTSFFPGSSPATPIPLLVRRPIPLTRTMLILLQSRSTGHSLHLDVSRRYNTVLGRPRRNRLIITPGSVVLAEQVDDAIHEQFCLPWKGFSTVLLDVPSSQDDTPASQDDTPASQGFGGSHSSAARETDSAAREQKAAAGEQKSTAEKQASPCTDFASCDIIKNIHEYCITPSQAGLLRELINQNISREFIEIGLTHRLEKYKTKNDRKMSTILTTIQEALATRQENRSGKENTGLTAMRTLISCYLEALAEYRWLKTNKQLDQETAREAEK